MSTCLLAECNGPVREPWKLCRTELFPLALVCFGKARRPREDAFREVKRRGRAAHRCYPCPVCSTWHVGRKRPEVPDGTIRAREIVQQLRTTGLAWYVGQLAEEFHPRFVTRDHAGVWKQRMVA